MAPARAAAAEEEEAAAAERAAAEEEAAAEAEEEGRRNGGEEGGWAAAWRRWFQCTEAWGGGEPEPRPVVDVTAEALGRAAAEAT